MASDSPDLFFVRFGKNALLYRAIPSYICNHSLDRIFDSYALLAAIETAVFRGQIGLFSQIDSNPFKLNDELDHLHIKPFNRLTGLRNESVYRYKPFNQIN